MKRIAAAMALAAAVTVLAPGAAMADPYDKHEAGHPLKVVATILYPVGWVLDHALARPLHWLLHQEPANDVFGHDDFDRSSAFD